MLEVKDEGRLRQITRHCLRIMNKINNVTQKQFNSDEDLREIICFNIFQIGELAKGLSTDLTKKYNEIPWKQIKGMRDIIGHGYGTIDNEIVYNTAKESIPELNDYCNKIIDANIQKKS